MKKLLAIALVTLIASLGFAGTAAATTEQERVAQCEAAFDEKFLDMTAHLDDVQFFQLLYDIEDLFNRFDMGHITEDELLAGLDALLPGLVNLIIEFFDCIDAEEPVKPPIKKKPGPVPTSVPAGHDSPDGGPVASVVLIGLSAAAVSGLLILLRRRLVN
jgi:hypothetical protein